MKYPAYCNENYISLVLRNPYVTESAEVISQVRSKIATRYTVGSTVTHLVRQDRSVLAH